MHGFSRDEALYKLEKDLNNALDYGDRVVRIIHGRGNHSATFPVIKSVIRHWIKESEFAREHIESVFRGEDGSPFTLPNPGETVVVLKVRELKFDETRLDYDEEEKREARRNAKKIRSDRLRALRRRRF